MQPSILIGQIDRFFFALKQAFLKKFEAEKKLDKVLYDKTTKLNHWQEILIVLFSEANRDLTEFESIEALDQYFYDMQVATESLQSQEVSAEKFKSPLYTYCLAEQIDYNKIHADACKLFSKIIGLIAILIRQKYLLMQFSEDETADYFGDKLDELDDKYQKIIDELNANEDKNLSQHIDQMKRVQATLTNYLGRLGYQVNTSESKQAIVEDQTGHFSRKLKAYLAALPIELTRETSLSLAKTYQAASEASCAGKEEELYHYRVEALAKSYRIKEIHTHLETEMQTFLAKNDNLCQQLEIATENANWLEHHEGLIFERLMNLIQRLLAIREGISVLNNALQTMCNLVKFKEEEIFDYLKFRKNYAEFYNCFTVHANLVKSFKTKQSIFTELKESKTTKLTELSHQLKGAKKCWEEASHILISTATQYEEIVKFMAQISLYQHIKANWKISTLFSGLALVSFGSLSYFYLALNASALVAVTGGAGVCGLLLGFAVGLGIDYLIRKKLPHPVEAADKYFSASSSDSDSDSDKDSYVVLFESGLKPTPSKKPAVIVPTIKPAIQSPLQFSKEQKIIPVSSHLLKK